MSQSTMVILNDTGQNVRNAINAAFLAAATNSSGATAPTTTYAFQLWVDTTNNLLKIRDAANATWITLGIPSAVNLGNLPLTGGTLTGALSAVAGLLATPGITFGTDTDTGFYEPASKTVGVVSAGVEYIRVSSAGTAFAKNFNGGLANDAATGSNQTLTTPTTPLVRLTSGTLASIDGIPAGQAGQFLVLMNATGVSLNINDETGATTANRIRTGSGSVFSFANNAAVFMIYDSTSARWRMIGGAGGGSRVVSTFNGTLITPVAGSTDQTFLYTGGTPQTFTGFGTLSGLTNGSRFRIMGSDDTNTLTINHNDATDGWLTNGTQELGRGQFLDCEYNSTLARVVIL